MKMNPVLSLDLATRTGWCVGAPGDRQPKSGSIRFASAGASHEAMFYGAWEWTQTIIVEHRPTTIVWEAPMPTSFNRGSTNVNVTTVLYGLPAVIGAAAYRLGVFDCRKANTKDVRNHFSRAAQARWRVGCGYPTMLALRSARYYYDA
jgi:hypothetical protein